MKSDSAGRAAQAGTYVGDPTTLTLGVASARTALLKPNTIYALLCKSDAFFKWGGSAVTATLSSQPLIAGIVVLHRTDTTNLYIAGIVSSGTPILYVSEIDIG